MQEIVCYTTYLPEGTEQYITFMELLLDDNWANGTISCPDEVYCEIGNINTKLASKQNYEFLLRAVQKYPFAAVSEWQKAVPVLLPQPWRCWLRRSCNGG